MSLDYRHVSFRIFSRQYPISAAPLKDSHPQITATQNSGKEKITDSQLVPLRPINEGTKIETLRRHYVGLIRHFLQGLRALPRLHSHPLEQLRISLVKLYYALPIWLRLFGFTYNINARESLISSATVIMFVRKDNGNVDLCFKMWRECDNALYHTIDLQDRAKYLLEGLKFNKPFARGVYFGIAPIRSVSKDKISCGRLIWFPFFLRAWRTERSGQEYVLVMRCLKQNWRLDHQLLTESMKTKEAMAFLAGEIAKMHSQLKPAYGASGNADSIFEKLKLNEKEFSAALDELSSQGRLTPSEKNKYKSINAIMKDTYKKCAVRFEERYKSGYIRRCHGDLKATNLWVRRNSKNGQRELLALDCVDFKPEFCQIDILSDVAMLAIDLEMRLTRWSDNSDKCEDKKTGRKLSNHFLHTYLKKTTTKEDAIWLLLEYYMTEKAMVCAFMSILYDQLPTLGEKYLDVAFAHAQRLQKKLELLPRRQLVYSR